jgi:hypothetical protein
VAVRVIFAMGWSLVGAIAIFVIILSAHGSGYLVVFPEGKQQVELASLFLAAASLIITATAIGLAVAGAVGYTALRDAARDAGAAAGQRAAAELLETMVQREVAVRMAAMGGPDRTEELTAALAARGNDAKPTQN